MTGVRHYEAPRRNPRRHGVDLEAALAASPAKVRDGLFAAHEALNAVGVAHVIVGGLAVAAHGFERATHDIDFMVSDNAFQGSLVITHAPGVPIQANGVLIDYLGAEAAIGGDRILQAAARDDRLHVVPIEQLIAMKLTVFRPKDRADVAGLVEVGAFDVDEMRAWLAEHAPDLVAWLDKVLT